MTSYYPRLRFMTWVLIGFLSVLLIDFTVEIINERKRVEAQAVEERRNLVVVLSEQLKWTITDLVEHLEPLAAQIAKGKTFEEARLGSDLIDHELLDGEFWINKKGMVQVAWEDFRKVPAFEEDHSAEMVCEGEVAESDRVKLLKPLFLSNGSRAVPLLYRVLDKSGHCIGSLGVSISFDRLRQFYSEINIPEGTSVIVLSKEAFILFRYPIVPSLIGYRVPDKTMAIGLFPNRAETEWGYTVSPVDGSEKLHITYVPTEFPFIMSLVASKSTIFAEWYRLFGFRVAILMVVIAIFVGLNIYISRRISLQQRYQRNLHFIDEQIRRTSKLAHVGRMAAGISTDFNNIVHAMQRGFAGLREVPEARDLSEMPRLERSIERADQLVRYIVQMSAAPEKMADASDVSLVAAEVKNLLLSRLPSHINFNLYTEKGAFVNGAETELHQILMNLCTNAIDAMRTAGGELTVKVMRDSANQNIILVVEDTGVGISEEKLPLIFEPHFTTKAHGKGTGLGLSVTKDLVRSLKGELSVESRVGHGTKMTISLPLATADAKADEGGPEVPKKGKVLVVDDDEVISSLVSHMVTELGFEVETYNHPSEALAAFEHHWHQFNLAILDFQMPDLNGAELASTLREVNPSLPIVMMSGYVKSAEQALSSRPLAGDKIKVLPKPLSGVQITEVIEGISNAL